MARKFAKKVLAFAPESTYGTDAIDGGSPSYVLGREVSITPMAGESTALDYDDGKLGNSPELPTEIYVTLEFGCDFSGSGTANQPAPWAGLAEACLRTATVGSSPEQVSYALDDNSTASNTFYFYMDGVLHALVGARGSMSLSLVAKQFPQMRYTFTGLFVKPKAGANPAASFSDWQTPLKVGAEYTSASLAGNSVKLISLEYDQANQVSYEEYIGHEEVMISDYQPSGTLVLEAGSLGSFDPFAKAETGETVAFSLTHGIAGNQVQWSTDKLQLGRPTYGDQNGTLTYSIPVRPIGDGDQIITA
ncbi:phage tail tube protein [Endozoicomonas numazuensis]|uniref:Uncharacterized protein n=1 Tax=Endozoicomonas numazuensis TaxID=1137799 RepID=A0A081NL47_9GAMM|nr:phage tail tube protein [Endozoicomonas numazuensis]KEQ19170.1 hypothetical protein GZ78_04015 [Endozoicomonas numazuensis]